MMLGEILSGVKTASVSGGKDVDIASLSFDSRKVVPGGLFFTLPGSKTDGNRFVRQAVEKGAAAVVSELKIPPAPMSLVRPGSGETPVTWVQAENVFAAMGRAASNFYSDPSSKLCVVGITGTNGKTTTSYFLESIFARAGGVPGVIGTVSHRLRGRILEKAVNTTPFSLDLIRLLARMRDEGGTHVAMETSSHALAAQRVDEIHFDAAILTNLHSDHLDFHKTREEYFEAKAKLFQLLERADSHKEARVAIVNRDDEIFEKIRHRVFDERLVSVGMTAQADYFAAGAAQTISGSTFRIHRGKEEFAATIRLPGEHNIRNALSAFACARELGIPPRTVLEGLADLERIPGRLDPVSAGQSFSVCVDFAHTESALSSVLDSLNLLPHRKIITVFGCGGDRDKSKRGPMGAAACAGSDIAIATSDNPRSEDPMEILKAVEKGMHEGGYDNYRIIPDRKEAIYEAIKIAQKDDIVLIAGKGHETVQYVGEQALHFDDAQTARDALKDCARI